MTEFILKYWIQVVFALISGGAGIACKYFYNLYKKEQLHQKTEEQKAFYKDITETIQKEHKLLFEEIEKNKLESDQKDKELSYQIKILTAGILTIQGKAFKEECRRLLDPSHVITLEEYEVCKDDHTVYNSLGGNHDGDKYFELVTKKFESGLRQ